MLKNLKIHWATKLSQHWIYIKISYNFK